MKITKLLSQKSQDLSGCPIPTIAFLGDSVTQGCFELYLTKSGEVETVFEQEEAYHAKLAKMLHLLYPCCPVSIINAGISGTSAALGWERLERDVLSHHPDLTVVAFGLNDCSKGDTGIPVYAENLRKIFTALTANGSEVIYLTQNMMNTEMSHRLQEPKFRHIAEATMKRENDGLLERYFAAGKETARSCGVRVCDIYTKWKRLQQNGVNTTELLSNAINHPVREMHWLTASSLLETIME